MRVFVIRDKESGELMPQAKKEGGYSHWLSPEGFQYAEPYPRLFTSSKKAKKCVVEWSKGVPRREFRALDFDDPGRVTYEKHGREASDLEVVQYELKEVV